MIISPREASDRRRQAPAGLQAAGGKAAGGEAAANRLNPDEWEFLRATPDFDAEEMSSVTVTEPGYRSRFSWDEEPVLPTPAAETLDAPSGDFPELGSLTEMLGDLIEPPGGPGARAAEAAWANIPAAAEWASLMEPSGRPERAPRSAGATPPALPARDVLLDALAADAGLSRR
jgi:hypothetical protein